MQDQSSRRTDRHGQGIGDGVVDRQEFELPGPEPLRRAGFDLDVHRGDPVLGELAPHEAQGQPRSDERDVGALTQQVRHAADVVLVRVREDESLDLIEPTLQGREVREDEVNAWLIVFGEQDPAVDDEQPAGMLEHRHVPADLAEATERDHAQAISGQGRWRPQLGVRVTHLSFTPPAAMSVRSWSTWLSVASVSGSRTRPPGRPSKPSAALVMMTP